MSDKILNEVRVLDTTQWVTGGFATLMLANQGAEVIKVERPKHGDDIRHSGPPFIEDESPYYWTVNYGKKSIELDLKSERGKGVMYDLAEDCDVFVENFRPGKIAELGFGYDVLSDLNDEQVYCSISAFGETGPWSSQPGYDLLLQGMSGIMDVTGNEDGGPVKVGVAITDIVTGMWAAYSIVNALYRREQTGQGEYVELAMLDSMIPLLTKQAGKVFAGGESSRMGTRDPMHAPYQAFEALDGYINIACGNQTSWERLCEALDMQDLLDDERFMTNPDRVKHMDALEAELEETLGNYTVNELVELIADEHGVPAGPQLTVAEALEHEQVRSRGTIHIEDHTTAGEQPVIDHPMKYLHSKSGFDEHASVLGEHSREILLRLGYTDDEIKQLMDEEVVCASGLDDV